MMTLNYNEKDFQKKLQKDIDVYKRQGWSSEIHLTIKEGKFHQVKRMTEAVGKKVVYLKRISMGVLNLPDDLTKGECRQLTAEEEKKLKDSIVTK